MSGTFVTFEGLEGAGKTTVLNEVSKRLPKKQQQRLVFTREPGGTKIAEEIRNILVAKQDSQMDSRTEALLMAASRREDVQRVIKPALAQDKIVLCDRFLDSSIAYQGGGRSLGAKAVYDLNQFATEGINPDVTFYFQLPIEVGLARIKKYRNKSQINRLDEESIAFYQRTEAQYDELAKEHPDRIIIIDAQQSLDNVVKNVETELEKRINP